MNKTVIFGVVSACLWAGSPAQANLVVNGGFEAGGDVAQNYPGPAVPGVWYNALSMFTLFGYDTDTSHIVSNNAHTGTSAAALTQGRGTYPVLGADMYQTFTVVGGEATTFDFWVKTTGAGILLAGVNGVLVTPTAGLTFSGSTEYTEYSFIVAPTQSTNGVVEFKWGSATGATLYLDDVVVTQGSAAVPEPSTIISGGILLLPFGASALRFLRRRSAA